MYYLGPFFVCRGASLLRLGIRMAAAGLSSDSKLIKIEC